MIFVVVGSEKSPGDGHKAFRRRHVRNPCAIDLLTHTPCNHQIQVYSLCVPAKRRLNWKWRTKGGRGEGGILIRSSGTFPSKRLIQSPSSFLSTTGSFIIKWAIRLALSFILLINVYDAKQRKVGEHWAGQKRRRWRRPLPPRRPLFSPRCSAGPRHFISRGFLYIRIRFHFAKLYISQTKQILMRATIPYLQLKQQLLNVSRNSI